jgi:alkylation response protein AidB-like acyl-CoA dehydrogenase
MTFALDGAPIFELQPVPEQTALLRAETRRFALEVIRPAAQQLDQMSPAERIRPQSPLFDVLGQLKSLGYHRLFVAAGADIQATAAAQAVVLEELGWGSLGLATAFVVDMLPFRLLHRMGGDAAHRELVVPWLDNQQELHGCWAVTEALHGSDALSLRDAASGGFGPGELQAEPAPGGWTLRGRKSAWVSSAPIATHAVVRAQVGGASSPRSTLLAVVDLDQLGVRRGPPVDMLGAREDPQGELVFERVQVPASRVLAAPGPATVAVEDQVLGILSTALANIAVGLARASFEAALHHARSRVQGGVPIAAHKNIQLTLYSMFEKTETARVYARAALTHLAQAAAQPEAGEGEVGGASARHTRTAQIYAKRIAFEVASDAVQVLGAQGLSRDQPVEKWFRDARSLLIQDGTVEVLALEAARDILAGYEHDTPRSSGRGPNRWSRTW